MKKIKITEEQLKRLVENKSKQVSESKESKEKTPVNEAVEKIKSDFKRFK
jgi:hypothetical protein